MGHELVVAFDTDNAEFTRGVEVGMVFERLLRDDRAQSMPMHVTNAEMALRLAEMSGRQLRISEHPAGWMTAHFSEAR